MGKVLLGSLLFACAFAGTAAAAPGGVSVHLDASAPHSYRGISKNPARAIVITVPPRI